MPPHHVNETASRDLWKWWDLGFLLWGASMLIGGWFMARAGEAEQDAAVADVRQSPKRPTPMV